MRAKLISILLIDLVKKVACAIYRTEIKHCKNTFYLVIGGINRISKKYKKNVKQILFNFIYIYNSSKLKVPMQWHKRQTKPGPKHFPAGNLVKLIGHHLVLWLVWRFIYAFCAAIQIISFVLDLYQHFVYICCLLLWQFSFFSLNFPAAAANREIQNFNKIYGSKV